MTSSWPDTPQTGSPGATAVLLSAVAIVIPIYTTLKDGVVAGLVVIGAILGLSALAFVFLDARRNHAKWRRAAPTGAACVVAFAIAIGILVAEESADPRRKTDVERVEQLTAGLPLAEFKEILGRKPHLTAKLGGLRESLFVDDDFFVQTLSDDAETVVLFSVSTRNDDFNPTFEVCESSGPGRRVRFVLGSTRMSAFDAPFAGAMNVSAGSDGYFFTELRAGAHVCDFRWEAYTYNGAVVGNDRSGHLASQSSLVAELASTGLLPELFALADDPVDEFDQATIAVSAFLADVVNNPDFARHRGLLTPNTYTETIGARDFFIRYPLVFSEEVFRIAFGPSREQAALASTTT